MFNCDRCNRVWLHYQWFYVITEHIAAVPTVEKLLVENAVLQQIIDQLGKELLFKDEEILNRDEKIRALEEGNTSRVNTGYKNRYFIFGLFQKNWYLKKLCF